jgi:hypothetical protein
MDDDQSIAVAAEPDEASAPVAPQPAKKQDDRKKWYVIHTYSGYENKVKANLERRIHSMNMQDKIFRVLVPMEDEVEFKDGKRKITPKKVFPGYVLVEMDMDDGSWYVVRNTSGVTGFVVSSATTSSYRTRPRRFESSSASRAPLSCGMPPTANGPESESRYPRRIVGRTPCARTAAGSDAAAPAAIAPPRNVRRDAASDVIAAYPLRRLRVPPAVRYENGPRIVDARAAGVHARVRASRPFRSGRTRARPAFRGRRSR